MTYAIDPGTLDEVFPDSDEVRARIRYLDARTHDGGSSHEWFGLADEIIVLCLAAGELYDALGFGCWADEWSKSPEFRAHRPLAAARLAHVHSRRGEYGEATMTFLDLLLDPSSYDRPTEALIHHLAGRNDYAQQLWDDAREHFAHALAIREKMGDAAAIAESTLALRAAERRC